MGKGAILGGVGVNNNNKINALNVLHDLEGDPVPPKLFLAPAKDGGAPPNDGRVGGAVVS
jgi:hypothetical protein